jgi:phosphoglucosamine mutase
LAQTGKSLGDLAGVMTRLPQVLVNVPNVDKNRAGTDADVQAAVAAATARLGGTGRVLLRPSGTEPLVRVMVEAESSDTADEVAHDLAKIVETALKL